jgi:hypothetical protein
MQAAAPPQPITQLSKLLHSVEAAQVARSVQQLALAHTSHWDADGPALHAAEPASPPLPSDPLPRGETAQLASPVGVQSPSAGGRGGDEHAPRTTSTAAVRAPKRSCGFKCRRAEP